MLEDRIFSHSQEAPSRNSETGFSAAAEDDTKDALAKFPSLGESGLKKWCVEGYLDPRTWNRIYGKDVLLSAFFGKRGFWIELFEYVESLSVETIESIGWRIPWDRASFSYRIKKSGYDRISPKNVCLWLGALDENRGKLADDVGNLSAEGLANWCHEGYENESGKRVYGKDVLVAAVESGDFWNEIDSYAERLGRVSTKNAGGRFPKHPKMFAGRLLKDASQWITVARIFAELGIRMPKPERVRQSSKGFLSWAELRDWCAKGYKSASTGQRVFGKHVLLDALYSGTFWVEFERYAESLGKVDVARIGWLIPRTPSGYEERVAEAGFATGAKGTCQWFWALDAESAEFCDDTGFLNGKWLVRWFHEGYVSEDGKTVLGKDVLDWCFNSRSFWNSFEKYVSGITDVERRNMGGRFPKHAKSLGERTVWHETSIEELYAWFKSPVPDERESWSKFVETREVETYQGPRASALPFSLSKETKGRVRSFIRKVLEIADPEKSEPLGTSLFKVRETHGEIWVSCSSKRLVAKLVQYRAYVDDTLSYDASVGLEKPLGFEWKDFKKTGANEKNG